MMGGLIFLCLLGITTVIVGEHVKHPNLSAIRKQSNYLLKHKRDGELEDKGILRFESTSGRLMSADKKSPTVKREEGDDDVGELVENIVSIISNSILGSRKYYRSRLLIKARMQHQPRLFFLLYSCNYFLIFFSLKMRQFDSSTNTN